MYTIIFDMDGVILDSETISDKTWLITQDEMNVKTDKDYINMCRGSNRNDTLQILHEAGTHLEITNLLIPEVNDDIDMIRRMCQWLVEHGMQDCPLHFSRFFPRYKMRDSYPTPKNTLLKARDIALEEGIRWVYLGNI